MSNKDRREAREVLDLRRANGGMGIDEYEAAIAAWEADVPKKMKKGAVSTMPDHAEIPDDDEDKLSAEEKVEQAYIEDQVSHEIAKKC